jgi:hypothetical protein
MKIVFLKFLTLAVFAFSGGMVSNYLIFKTSAAFAGSNSSSSFFSIHDRMNQKGIETYVYNGYPAQNFYAKDGKIRIQQGIYNAPGEDGLPLIGMSDNKNHLKMLFRLAGKNESPVIIMKDNQQRDRLVLGLDLNNPDQAPFLVTFDNKGKKQVMFGSY